MLPPSFLCSDDVVVREFGECVKQGAVVGICVGPDHAIVTPALVRKLEEAHRQFATIVVFCKVTAPCLYFKSVLNV
jgi:hypothetical protein